MKQSTTDLYGPSNPRHWIPPLQNRENTTRQILKIFHSNNEYRENYVDKNLPDSVLRELYIITGSQVYGAGKTTFISMFLQFLDILLESEDPEFALNDDECALAKFYIENPLSYFSLKSIRFDMLKVEIWKAIKLGSMLISIDEIGFLTEEELDELLQIISKAYTENDKRLQFMICGKGTLLWSRVMYGRLSPFQAFPLVLNPFKATHINNLLSSLNLNVDDNSANSVLEYSGGNPLLFRKLVTAYIDDYFSNGCVFRTTLEQFLNTYKPDNVILTLINIKEHNTTTYKQLLGALLACGISNIGININFKISSNSVGLKMDRPISISDFMGYAGLNYIEEEGVLYPVVPKILQNDNFLYRFDISFPRESLGHYSVPKNKGMVHEHMTVNTLYRRINWCALHGDTLLTKFPNIPESMQTIVPDDLVDIVTILGVTKSLDTKNKSATDLIRGMPRGEIANIPKDYKVKGASTYYFWQALKRIKKPTILIPLSESNFAFDEAVFFPKEKVLWFIQDKNYTDINKDEIEMKLNKLIANVYAFRKKEKQLEKGPEDDDYGSNQENPFWEDGDLISRVCVTVISNESIKGPIYKTLYALDYVRSDEMFDACDKLVLDHINLRDKESLERIPSGLERCFQKIPVIEFYGEEHWNTLTPEEKRQVSDKYTNDQERIKNAAARQEALQTRNKMLLMLPTIEDETLKAFYMEEIKRLSALE